MSAAHLCVPFVGLASQDGDADDGAGETGAVPDYRIMAGDVLHLLVWKEPTLTSDLSVRIDGMITVPLVGDVEAAGRTPAQLTAEVREALGAFLEVPNVTIGVAEASASFYIIGEVGRSGAFPLRRHTTVLQGLALAGGLREFAKGDQILIIRGGAEPKAVPFDYRELSRGTNLAQNILLEDGDTIIVP